MSPRAGAQASATRGRIYRQQEDRGIHSDKPREFISWQTRFRALFFLPLSFPPPSLFLSFLLLPHSFLPSFSLFPSIFPLPPLCLSLFVTFSLSIVFLKKNNTFPLVNSIFTPHVASSLDGQTFVSGIRVLANLKVVKLHVGLLQFSYSKYFRNNFHYISTSP